MKRLGGCLLIFAVLLAAASWWGWRQLQKASSGDGASRVAIAAPANRVFASLTNGDSIPTWMAQGSRVTVSRRGPLLPGDTLRVEMKQALGPRQHFTWKVKKVVPDRLVVMEMRSGANGMLIAQRRDSLAAAGDSTLIVSTVGSPGIDSVLAARRGTGDSSREVVLDMTSRLLVSMVRMQSQLDLLQLKNRIEGAPGRPPDTATAGPDSARKGSR
ncbi:MAG: SRPBCC domain-containing protein [Gemmatimonadales bacterium]